MAISFSRPDPSSPAAVAAANFTMARRGFDPDEVNEFLRMVAAELARLQERERFLERELRATQYSGSPVTTAVDEDMVTKVLGEEAARILTTSREAAAQIKARAEENAARLLREATDEAQRVREEAEIEAARHRQDSASDAESEIQMAKQQGREMVNEARAYRERVLGDLARRRELARQQIEALVHGRDRLLSAFERARVAAVEVMADLTPLTEPTEIGGSAPSAFAPDAAGARSATATAAASAESAEAIAAAEAAAAIAAITTTSDEAVAAADAMLAAATAVVDAATSSVDEPRVPGPPPSAPPAPSARAADVTDIADTTLDDNGAADGGSAEAPTVRRAPRRRGDTVVLLPEPAPSTAAPTDEQGSGRPDEGAAHGTVDDTDPPARARRRDHLAPVVSLFAGSEAQVPGRPQPPAPPEAPITESRRTSAPAPDTPDDARSGPNSDHPVHQPATTEGPAATSADQPAVKPAEKPAEKPAGPSLQPAAEARDSVDDLFARLRASRAGAVAERARADHPSSDAGTAAGTGASASGGKAKTAKQPTATKPTSAKATPGKPTSGKPTSKTVASDSPSADSPSADRDLDDSPFRRRDAELTPLIVMAARKLKRALADEQNDVMLVLRRKEPVSSLDALLPTPADHARRYEQAVRDELVQAALAGAASLDDGPVVEHQRAIDAHHALGPAMEQLAASIITPLRERLDRAVNAAAGDNAAVVDAVRAVYREWKTQRIDEHLDDVVRTAFGRGAYVVLVPGTRVCWTVDPNGPDCPDAEDNTLGGVVRAGDRFPTDHVCAPAHEGCRCMLQRVRQ